MGPTVIVSQAARDDPTNRAVENFSVSSGLGCSTGRRPISGSVVLGGRWILALTLRVVDAVDSDVISKSGFPQRLCTKRGQPPASRCHLIHRRDHSGNLKKTVELESNVAISGFSVPLTTFISDGSSRRN